MDVPVRVWELHEGIAKGMRLDVGEPVEFEVAPGDSIVLTEREVGTRSRPTMVAIRRLRPWLPSWVAGAGG